MKQLRFFLLVITIVLLSLYWLFPQVAPILYAKYHTFEAIGNGIYSSSKPSTSTSKEFLKFKKKAAEQVANFWGDRIGTADIFYCDNPTIYNKLCQSTKGSGCSVITPFGSWIILNYNGMNDGVIAHEMCHDELASRIGWWKSRTSIPKWLDEGIALQVDNRFVSTTDSIQRYIDYKAQMERLLFTGIPPIALKDLTTEEQFFSNNPNRTQLAYLTAATQVAKLISKHGKQAILDKIVIQDPSVTVPTK